MTDKAASRQYRLAVRDMGNGIAKVHLWWLLAWMDITQRYRGSVLGPFWLSLNSAIVVASLGYVYAALLKIDVSEYLPFLALGILIWQFIATMLQDACAAFFTAEAVIKQIKLPLSVYIYRVIARNLLIFAHNGIVSVVVLVIFDVNVGPHSLLAIPGMLMIVICAIPIATVLATYCARFRDVPQIVAGILQIVFYVTPIMWKPELLQNHKWLTTFNPFFAFIDIVRAPLLGGYAEPGSWLVAGACVLASWAIALPLFSRARGRVAYWV